MRAAIVRRRVTEGLRSFVSPCYAVSSAGSVISERQACPQLDLPRGCDGVEDPTERGEWHFGVGLSRVNRQRRHAEIGAVQHVERLEADLERAITAESCPGHQLRERQVERAQVRSSKLAAASVA